MANWPTNIPTTKKCKNMPSNMELRKLGLQTCSCPNFRPSLQIPLLARQATDPPSRWPSATWCYLCTKATAVWGTLSANLFKRLPFPGQAEPFNKNLLRTKNKVSCGRPGATSPLWRSTGKQSDDGTAARRFCWVLGWRCIAKKCPSSLWVGFAPGRPPKKNRNVTMMLFQKLSVVVRLDWLMHRIPLQQAGMTDNCF